MKTDHVIMRNGGFFCSHCGESYIPTLPVSVPVFLAMSTAFTKEHKRCPKTWQEPVAGEDLSENEKVQFWLENGERGISSETIFTALSGLPILPKSRWHHPCDPSDFNRCHLLLETVPEWRNRLDELKPLSPVWSKLVENWAKLTELLKDNMARKADNGMYKFMKGLGC